LLYAVLAVIFLVSAGFIANYIHGEFMFRHGSGHSISHTPEQTPDRYFPMPSPSTPAPTVAPATPAPVHPAPTPEPTPEPTPDPGPTPPPRVQRQEFIDYRAHYGNESIVGRVWIPNTSINYLVTQGIDNFFYLDYDIHGRRSLEGWIYLCTHVDIHAQDQNMIIFGHNTQRDHMFHAVRRFLNRDFFFNNRYIYFSTIYADYVFEVFSVYVTHVDWPYIYNNYNHLEGGWEYFINAFADRSLFDAGIEVSENDRVLTLSTCDNVHIDYRIAVHARLVSETFPHLDIDHDMDNGLYYDGVRG